MMSTSFGQFPHLRMRRMRKEEWSRKLVQENDVTPNDLIYPMFVHEGHNVKTPIDAMPGQFRYSTDLIVEQAKKACNLGIPAIALFPNIDPSLKDEEAKEAFNSDNLICRTIKAIKDAVPSIGVICDVALDPYTVHGHDGIIKK